MELLPEIQKRISIRKFTDTPVQKQQIDRILEAGRLAPSAKNRQAWRFIVIREPELRKKMESACFGQEYIGQAPLLITICTTNIDYKMPNGQYSYPVDLGIAGAFMMLQATHEGLGSCAVTTFDEAEVKALLSVPHSMRVVMLLAIGHPDETLDRARRFPLSRIVAYEHW
ncbi:MAG: nitroreductase [Spirochaetaceae bacterium]|nr:MAG: nitroreductase [Spirochaetaceae bacterium]